jgi:hypothetical protein
MIISMTTARIVDVILELVVPFLELLTSGIANTISGFPVELTQEMVQPALVLHQQS